MAGASSWDTTNHQQRGRSDPFSAERKKCWHRCQRENAMKTEPTQTLAAVAPATSCSACGGSGIGPSRYRPETDKPYRDKCYHCHGTGIKLRDPRYRDDGWKPIETSPKEGGIFLAYVPHGNGGFRFLATWNRRGRLVCTGSGDDYTSEATLWTGIPDLPKP